MPTVSKCGVLMSVYTPKPDLNLNPRNLISLDIVLGS